MKLTTRALLSIASLSLTAAATAACKGADTPPSGASGSSGAANGSTGASTAPAASDPAPAATATPDSAMAVDPNAVVSPPGELERRIAHAEKVMKLAQQKLGDAKTDQDHAEAQRLLDVATAHRDELVKELAVATAKANTAASTPDAAPATK